MAKEIERAVAAHLRAEVRPILDYHVRKWGVRSFTYWIMPLYRGVGESFHGLPVFPCVPADLPGHLIHRLTYRATT